MLTVFQAGFGGWAGAAAGTDTGADNSDVSLEV